MPTILYSFGLLILLNYASADQTPFSCPRGDVVVYPSSLNNTLYLPNNSTVPIPFNRNQTCSWAIPIPRGTYGFVTVNLNLCPDDYLAIRGVRNSFDHIAGYPYGADMPSKGTFHLYCPAVQCNVFLSAGTSPNCKGTFSLSLQSLKLPDLPSVDISSAEDKKVVSLQSLKGKQSFYNRTGDFTLRTIANECNWWDYRYDVCLVYKGNSVSTGDFIMGLSYNAAKYVFSFYHPITIFCFDDELPSGAQLLLTSVPSVGLNWQIGSNCSSFTEDNGNNNTYFTDYCPEECPKYVTSFKGINSSDDTLLLFSDVFDMDNSSLGSITLRESGSRLPQRIDGKWKTIYTSFSNVQLTADPSSWESPSSARRGFIASTNYGVSSSAQNFKNTFKSSKRFKYSYKVTSLYSGQLQIVADLGSGKTFNHMIYPNSTDSVKEANMNAYSMSISYDMGTSGPSKGAYLTYEIAEVANGASSTGFIIIFAVLLTIIF